MGGKTIFGRKVSIKAGSPQIKLCPIAFRYPTFPSQAYKYRSSSEERHRNHPLFF